MYTPHHPNKSSALVGATGFVGTTLLKQTQFDYHYRSTNIAQIEQKSFNHVVCAGAPAQKWLANENPVADKRNIEGLIDHLKTVRCQTFILISTVDVFKHPVEVDEETMVEETGLHAYGLYRRLLEKFVQTHFSNHLIIRLPGLVGPGLRKNIIFDFLHQNNLHAIDARAIFQFYPMVNLWYDIEIALRAGLNLLHLTAEPIQVAEIASQAFGRPFTQQLDSQPVCYDIRTRHAHFFGASGHYQYNRRETLLAVRAYAQSALVTQTKRSLS